MTAITFDKAKVNTWVAERIGRKAPWPGDEFQAFGIERDGVLVGGVVIDGIVQGARCSIHCAGNGRRWLTREFLRVVFDYAFRQLKVNVVINPVDSDNFDSMRFTAHLGFSLALCIPGAAQNADLLIYTMPRGACRWLAEKG